jgi:hypothetical protein
MANPGRPLTRAVIVTGVDCVGADGVIDNVVDVAGLEDTTKASVGAEEVA